MFSGYFNQLFEGAQKDNFSRAIAIASYPEIRSVIKQDGKISNIELSDFITLLNLNDSYYNRTLPGDNIRKIISIMKSQGSTPLIQNIATEVLGKINSSLPGSIATDFSLMNSDGKLMSLKDFRGKYLLLCFARSDSQASVMEMGIINMWYKKFIDNLFVVTILTDKDFKTASGILNNRGFIWTFLDGSKKEMIEFIFEIKMYPSFMLIDREGKIIADPSPFPSENLEAVIRKIVTGY
jgi:peroxiredoxin